jgi:hypothetical protein
MSPEREKPFSFGPEPSGGPVTRARPGWLKPVLIASLLGGAGLAYLYIAERERLAGWLEGTPLALPATVTRAYKWRDADGAWQITDTPPPAGTSYETMTVRGDVNVVPALRDADADR